MCVHADLYTLDLSKLRFEINVQSFVTLLQNFGVLHGFIQKSSLSTFLKRHVCGIPGDIDFVTELAKMQRKIDGNDNISKNLNEIYLKYV